MPVGRLLRTGLVGGIVVIYVALVGLLAKIAEINLIGTQVTGARAVLLFVPFLVAYIAVRPRVVAGEIVTATTRSAAMYGAIAGLGAGGSVAIALLFTNWYGVDRVGEIFIQVNPALLEILSFGKSVTVGAVILTVGGLLAGAAGGAFRTLAVSVRRPLATATAVTLLAGLLQRIIPIALVQLGITVDWLYSPATGGLTWLGAALFFAGSLLCSWGWTRRGKAASATVRTMVREQPGTRIIVLLVMVGVLATIPLLVGAVISEVLGTVMVFMLLGLGLNIVVGYAGLLDLGYVAFFGFGAYATALLTGATLNTTTGSAAPAFSMHLNFYVAIPIIVLLAAGVGVLIGAPVLRLRGDYLAIVTLGLGEMVSILISSNWLKPLVGGPQGMREHHRRRDRRLLVPRSAALLLPRARIRAVRDLLILAIGELTHRPRLERDARGRTGGRRHGHQHDPIQAPGVRDRRRGGLAGRRAVRGEDRIPHPGELRDHRLDHRARDRDPGRHGQHPRRGRRRAGPDRPARVCCGSSRSTGCSSTAPRSSRS